MIVDPLGRTVVDLGDREGVEIIEIDYNLVQDTRVKAAAPAEPQNRYLPEAFVLRLNRIP